MTLRTAPRFASALCLATFALSAACAQQTTSPSLMSVQDIKANTVPGPPRPQSVENGVQIEKPHLDDYVAMLDALPATAPAKPKKARRILVLAHAAGFYHSSIPLAADTVKEMGDKTGAYTADITYDPADINAANLEKYDAIFLDSTTLDFLGDPKDPSALDGSTLR